MRLDDSLEASAERLLRCNLALPNVLLNLRDGMTGLRGTSYDHNGGSRQWCWDHGCWVNECHRDDRDCSGETIEVHDPTGEAAVNANPARLKHRKLSRLARIIDKATLEYENIVASEQPARLVVERAGIGVCDGCGHYCDGVKDNRLRPVGEQRMCNRCRVRYSRAS